MNPFKSSFYFIFKIFFLILCFPVFAEENSDLSKTIDLGQMSVTGEVRKPTINWINSQKNIRDQLPEAIKIEFDEFEKELLKPREEDGRAKTQLFFQSQSSSQTLPQTLPQTLKGIHVQN